MLRPFTRSLMLARWRFKSPPKMQRGLPPPRGRSRRGYAPPPSTGRPGWQPLPPTTTATARRPAPTPAPHPHRPTRPPSTAGSIRWHDPARVTSVEAVREGVLIALPARRALAHEACYKPVRASRMAAAEQAAPVRGYDAYPWKRTHSKPPPATRSSRRPKSCNSRPAASVSSSETRSSTAPRPTPAAVNAGGA